MTLTKETLQTYTINELKKEISKTNIKRYSTLKKNEVINLMLKKEHIDKFNHLKKKEPKKKEMKKDIRKFFSPNPKKETKKQETKKQETKKQEKKEVDIKSLNNEADKLIESLSKYRTKEMTKKYKRINNIPSNVYKEIVSFWKNNYKKVHNIMDIYNSLKNNKKTDSTPYFKRINILSTINNEYESIIGNFNLKKNNIPEYKYIK
tara:strand:- start:792 stop:1409 length:618 start_codon:yes stop_codon:yes gene_type:complete